jgi:hypothetical protein
MGICSGHVGETHMCVHKKVCKTLIAQQGCAGRKKLHPIATEPWLHVKADRVLQILLIRIDSFRLKTSF